MQILIPSNTNKTSLKTTILSNNKIILTILIYKTLTRDIMSMLNKIAK